MKEMMEMMEVSAIEKIKPKRLRGNRVVFCVTSSEEDLIAEKMVEANMSNRGAYMRRMALSGYIIKLDFVEVKKMIALLSNATSNLNQIAKKVNTTGDIHAEDIKLLQGDYNKLWEQSDSILQAIQKL